MKTIRFKRVLACALTLLLFFSNVSAAFPIQSFAASEDVLTFRPIQNGNAYAVKYCDDSAKGTIIIPRTHNSKPVMRIDAYAFANCNDIEKIQIPDSITAIGNDVFTAMSSLEEINVESGNTTFNSDNGILYDYSMESLIKYPEGKKQSRLSIPNSIKTIRKESISSRYLQEIAVGSNVAEIEDYAFYCLSLERFSVPSENKHFKSIDGVLLNHSSTELIYYPIGNRRESYTLPENTTSIRPSAFFFCKLKEIVLPSDITHISNEAFYCCSDLTNLIIPDSVTSIGNSAFASCSSLTSVVIPNSVTAIGDGAFEDCDSVTNITIPDSVKSIGNYAFARCEQLHSVTIPDKTERVGAGAFWRCYGLTNVRVGNDVTQIGKYAFQYCRNLSTVTLGKKVTYIDDYAFDSCLA